MAVPMPVFTKIQMLNSEVQAFLWEDYSAALCGDLLYPISPKSVKHGSTVRNTFVTLKQVLWSLRRFSYETDAYAPKFCEVHPDECHENHKKNSISDGS
jgi:hypothetical protein